MANRPYLVFLFPIAVIIIFSVIGRLLRPHPAIKNFLTNLIAILFILAFAVPFTAGGIWMIAQGSKTHDPKLLVMAIPFLTIGLLFSAALIWGGPAVFKQNKTKAAHPDEPWMWQSDWASGVISSRTDSGAIGLWIFTVIWNGIAIPAAISVMQQYRQHADPKLLIVLLFPAVGLGMLIWALRATAQSIYFGNSKLHLRTIPAALGGALVGTIHIKRQLRCGGPVSLRLSCTRVDHSGKDSTQAVVWEDEQQLDRLPAAPSGIDIPVYFKIPSDQQATYSGTGAKIFWRLAVTAPTEGIHYRGSFKVPVFEVANAPVAPAIDDAAPFRHHDTPAQPQHLRGISVSRLADGGKVIHLAAARNPGAAATVTFFALIFTAIAAALPQSSAPIIFPIVFGLAAFLIDMAAINSWLSSATITVRPRSIYLDHGLPMMHRHRELPADSITSITEEISSTANNVTYYAIVAVADGKRIRLASGVRGKTHAEELVAEIMNGMGRERSAGTELRASATNI